MSTGVFMMMKALQRSETNYTATYTTPELHDITDLLKMFADNQLRF
jgi:hypothetical protein